MRDEMTFLHVFMDRFFEVKPTLPRVRLKVVSNSTTRLRFAGAIRTFHLGSRQRVGDRAGRHRCERRRGTDPGRADIKDDRALGVAALGSWRRLTSAWGESLDIGKEVVDVLGKGRVTRHQAGDRALGREKRVIAVARCP